jgi:cysteine-rich repeat protein
VTHPARLIEWWLAPGALCVAGALLSLSCGEAQPPAVASGGASGRSAAESGAGTSPADGGKAGLIGSTSGGATSTAGDSSTGSAAGSPSPSGGVTGDSAGAPSQGGGVGGEHNVDGGEGGIGGEGNSGGWGGECLVGIPNGAAAGAPPLHTGKVGEACADWGSLACAGANQKHSLVCMLGMWAVLQSCTENENCDQQTGRCASILPACATREPGALYCEEDTLNACGVDRVSVSASVCCGSCSAGACRAPSCGDGRTTAAEGCDDGNRLSGDGCDSDCQPSSVVQLVAGQRHSCALLREGRVRCWGGNDRGQLGRGDATNHANQHPYELGLVPLGARATQLVAGSAHTCALLEDGTIRCWGENGRGQLGLGHTQLVGDDELPDVSHAALSLGMKANRLTAGGESTCAQLEDGTLRCWGRNDRGQLGTSKSGDVGDDELPTAANAGVALAGHTAVAAGESGEHLCVALEDRSFLCWGDNRYQQLDFMRTWNLTGASPVVEILGSGWRTYTLLDDKPRGLFAAGFNVDGLLGSGGPSPTSDPSDTIYLRGQYGTVQAAAGPSHLCYLEANHTMRCVGLNDKGQLGFPDASDRYFPALVSLGTDAQANSVWALRIATGESHTCAWLNTGKLRCWGLNDSGQLGLGYASPAPLDHVGGSASDNAETAITVRLFNMK